MEKSDRKILRELGTIIKDIAADPVNEERKNLWKQLNGLKRVRPPVFIFEVPWNEMNHENELTLVCEDPFCRGLEQNLRRTIYQWRHFQGDMVVEEYIPAGPVIHDTWIGLKEDSDLLRLAEDTTAPSRHFKIQISSEADIEKIKMPVITHDEEATERNFRNLCDIFDGVLPVRKVGIKHTSVAPWDELVRFTGVTEIIMDMVTRPAYVHKLIGRMTDAYLVHLRQIEELNLLGLNNDSTILGGGLHYTDELPPKDFNPAHVRPKDMWGRTMSQIFSAVSPAMHDEFALQYELKYLNQFGLTYYGCCEPLHKKIDILRKVKNLRKISMSPWVNAEEGAEAIGKDYVYSFKPNPAFLSGSAWNPANIRKDMEENLKKTRNCATEIILKDISTVSYIPQRLWEWARIASETASSFC
jgi:hypothetical protein